MVSTADESESAGVPEPIEHGGAAPSLVGQTIAGRYTIERELGRGGMGAVYRAQHVTLGRAVAVKVLHPKLTADPAVSKRFDREALSASKLDHPNCVQVIDFGTTSDGMKYLVMQLLEGKELRDELGWPMDLSRALRLGGQILRALDHAHRKGLVHRDLKPENVFIVRDDDGLEHVKLVDFGIVKLLDGDDGHEKLTRAGVVFGTPRYMAPEQAAGGKIDERTDLYAVGVLLHEMLTGKPPFDGDEPTIILRMHMLADPPPLPEGVPAAVGVVIAKMLAKSPGERYASAREARAELEAAIAAPAAIEGSVSSREISEPLVEVPLQAPAPPLRVPPIVPPVVAPTVALPSPSASSSQQTLALVSPPGVTFPPPAEASGAVPPSTFGVGMPPSGTFQTVVALHAQTDLQIPRRRRRTSSAIVIALVLVGVGAWIVYGVFFMRGWFGS